MDSPDIDWNDLKYLLAAARAGTLAGAARALGVEHSTVGRRLTALERALGGPLVLRGPDGLKLTPLGLRAVEGAEPVEAAVTRMLDRARQRHERVRVAMPSGMSGFFTERLHRLRDGEPPVSLEVVSGAQAVDLARGESDLALRLGPIADPDLVARRLGEIGWALYGAPAYFRRKPPLADAEALAGHELIGYDSELAATPAARWIDDHAGPATIVMRSREMLDMLSAARSGAGLALMPCFMADRDDGLVRAAPDVLVSRELWLVYRRESRRSPAVQRVCDFVVQVVDEVQPWLAQGAAAPPAPPSA